MAAQPRYSDGPNEANGSPWFVPLTFLAVVILAAVFSRNWQVVAPGIATAQFLMAPWTTPRGDNDGLWVMIFVILAFLFVIEHLLAALTGTAVGRLRDRGSTGRKRVSA
jgi:RsiW-degrading membrane proteinase PrsW (M82 family)